MARECVGDWRGWRGGPRLPRRDQGDHVQLWPVDAIGRTGPWRRRPTHPGAHQQRCRDRGRS
eukprot:4135918-Pyramimonas_sp.AAC.1